MSAFRSLTITQDGFAFDGATGESYTLNSCGRVVLHQLQQGHNRQQIVHFLSDEFGIAPNTVERDVADFLQQLHTLGLIGVS